MLHILLLILKMIGIIFAVILGILIILIVIVAFIPIRYEISVKCDGDIESLKAKAKVTWLLHLLRADIFLKGKKLKWKARFAWVIKTNAARKSVTEETDEEELCESQVQPEEEETCEYQTQQKEEHVIEEPIHEESVHERISESNTEESEMKTFHDKVNKFVEKIKGLLEKKDKIRAFITNQAHKNAFIKTKKFLFTFIKRLKPQIMHGKVRFGFDDPAVTGKVLGGISMLYPVFTDSLEIIPDFEKQIVKGTLYLKGKIRLCHVVSLAVKLITCRDVRITYKDIRKFKL